jgi:3-oxoacyl-[acyl-carrier protein] reductase
MSERAMTSVPDTEGHGLLVGRVAIVTGGARGIGKAISKQYASEGARVVIADIDGALGEETAAEIRTSGGQSHAVQTDVSRADSVTAMTESALSQFGRIDILVNNAAVLAKLPRQPFADIPEEQWDLVMLVNVKGPWLCIRSVGSSMRDQGYGKIINMSSDMILSGVPGMLHYVASKGALMAMTRSLARELGPDGICVNAVAPGFTITDAAMAHGQEANERNIRTRAIQRAQSPEDLTGTLVYLASAASDFVTGQLVTVNGGSVLH